MVAEALLNFLSRPFTPIIISLSLFFCLASYFQWKNHHDVRYAYSHIFFLFLPIILFGATLPCSMDFYSGIFTLCTVALTKAIILITPFLAALFIGFCFVITPELHVRHIKAKRVTHGRTYSLIRARAATLGIRTPRVFVESSSYPLAFSFSHFQSALLLSQGLIDSLTRKELEAVILHELGHLKHRSSFSKISSLALQFISPVARFNGISSHTPPALEFTTIDEARADAVAWHVQRSKRFIESARKKVQFFS